MAATQLTVMADTELIDQARKASGLDHAPIAEVVRRALLTLAGHPDAATAAKVRMGRPPKHPRT